MTLLHLGMNALYEKSADLLIELGLCENESDTEDDVQGDNNHDKFSLRQYIPEAQLKLYEDFRHWQEECHINRLHKLFHKQMKIALGNVHGLNENESGDIPDYEDPKNTYQYIKKYYFQLSGICKYIVDSRVFQNIITLTIIVAGADIGAQTDPRSAEIPGLLDILDALDVVILYVFLSELVLKIVAEKFTPWRFFEDAWNVFDAIIVVGSFIPGSGSALILLRLLRLLRILKIAKAFPQLSVLINALIKGISSIGYVGIILLMTFYVFAIVGVILFQETDPWHFGSLHLTLLTLFRSATLDNWYEVLLISIVGCDQVCFFICNFICK